LLVLVVLAGIMMMAPLVVILRLIFRRIILWLLNEIKLSSLPMAVAGVLISNLARLLAEAAGVAAQAPLALRIPPKMP
jgi:hypothetical protein